MCVCVWNILTSSSIDGIIFFSKKKDFKISKNQSKINRDQLVMNFRKQQQKKISTNYRIWIIIIANNDDWNLIFWFVLQTIHLQTSVKYNRQTTTTCQYLKKKRKFRKLKIMQKKIINEISEIEYRLDQQERRREREKWMNVNEWWVWSKEKKMMSLC